MKVTLVRATSKPVEAMALAGSNCYDSKPSEGIVNHCYESGHHSIMEFADFHFHVEGVSRSLLAQLTRHRLASYSVRSQRYCHENNFDYITPHSIDEDKEYKISFEKLTMCGEMFNPVYSLCECNLTYKEMISLIKGFYNSLLKEGILEEDARYILPNACETVIDFKMNFRSLINFMNLRLCTRAQWEIRELAQQMKLCIVEKYPELEKYMVPKCEIHSPYCFCTEGSSCGKHPKLEDVFATEKTIVACEN